MRGAARRARIGRHGGLGEPRSDRARARPRRVRSRARRARAAGVSFGLHSNGLGERALRTPSEQFADQLAHWALGDRSTDPRWLAPARALAPAARARELPPVVGPWPTSSLAIRFRRRASHSLTAGRSQSTPKAGLARREAHPRLRRRCGEEGGPRGKHGFPRHAEGGTRTHTPFRAPDFESGASASSATSA